MHRNTLMLTIPLSLLVGSCQPADPSDSTPDSPPGDGVQDTGLRPAAAKTTAGPEAPPEGWESTIRGRIAAEARAITPRSGAFAADLPSLGLTEWWVSLGTGLEQGWWVPEAPAGAGSLVIDCRSTMALPTASTWTAGARWDDAEAGSGPAALAQRAQGGADRVGIGGRPTIAAAREAVVRAERPLTSHSAERARVN